MIAHAFWIGDRQFDMENIHFIYHSREKLLEMIQKKYKILEGIVYKEFEKNDSLFVVAKKKELSVKK